MLEFAIKLKQEVVDMIKSKTDVCLFLKLMLREDDDLKTVAAALGLNTYELYIAMVHEGFNAEQMLTLSKRYNLDGEDCETVFFPENKESEVN